MASMLDFQGTVWYDAQISELWCSAPLRIEEEKMKTIHSGGGQRGLRRPTATLGPSPTSLYAGEEGWPGAPGELLGLSGVQHNTQWRIDFCVMVWYDRPSRTKLFSNNVELKNGKGQMPPSFPSLCPSEKRADQSRDGRAERHRTQVRRRGRRPRLPPPLWEGPEEKRGAELCAGLSEIPAASAGMTEPLRGATGMEVSMNTS